MTEPGAGSDVAGIKTRAEKKGDVVCDLTHKSATILNGHNFFIVLVSRGRTEFIFQQTIG